MSMPTLRVVGRMLMVTAVGGPSTKRCIEPPTRREVSELVEIGDVPGTLDLAVIDDRAVVDVDPPPGAVAEQEEGAAHLEARERIDRVPADLLDLRQRVGDLEGQRQAVAAGGAHLGL